MSWGIGRGAEPRFETRLILTDDAGAHVRFTHGLEQELRLDQYVKDVVKFQGLPQPTNLDEVDTEQGAAYHSYADQWNYHAEKIITSALRMHLNRRTRHDVLPVQDHDTYQENRSLHTCLVSPSASTLSVLDGSEVDSYQPEDGSYQSEGESHQSGYGSHEPEDGCLDAEVSRQLVDEVRYRERTDAELSAKEKRSRPYINRC